MRIEQDSTETIDAGRKIEIVTKSRYDSANPEKKLKSVRTLGYQDSKSPDFRSDFDKDFDSIFRAGRRR